MAALDAAFALAEMHDAAVLVAQHLKFDVARPLDEFLEVHIGNAESLLRLIARGRERGGKLFLAADDAHPAPAASGGRFHDHRILDSRGFGEGRGFVRDDSLRARNDRHARGGHLAAGLIFFAHHAQQIRRRADEGDVRGLAHFGEVGVLGKESVAGMDRVDVGDFRGADHLRDVQVAFARARRPDAHGFIRKAHVQRVAVGFGIDRDRGDAQFLARIDHAQGDFTAIGDQDFSKHFRPKVAQASACGFPSSRAETHRLKPVLLISFSPWAAAQTAVRRTPPAGRFRPELAPLPR